MLDAQARAYNDDMALAAARAIADTVGADKLNASVIVPSVFDSRVAPAVAAAVRAVAKREEGPRNQDGFTTDGHRGGETPDTLRATIDAVPGVLPDPAVQ
jgi:malic enzyme